MVKKSNPALEKKEEKLHKDLDGDGENGEPRKHQMKVLGKKAVKGKNIPPMLKNKKMSPPNDKKSKPSPGVGSKMCPACTRGGASSCGHI